MSKRQTVKVNCEQVLELAKKNEWSNAAFSRKVGKYSTWFGEVLRNKNLPSPEEAAKMCLLLNTTPEEILTEPADIELVNGLIESERAKHAKKLPATPGGEDGLTDLQKEAWKTLCAMDDDTLRAFITLAKRKTEG